MEAMAIISAVFLTLALATVVSWQRVPGLNSVLVALYRVKAAVLLLAIGSLLTAAFEWIGFSAALAVVFVAYCSAGVRFWQKSVDPLRQRCQPYVLKAARVLTPVLRLLAPDALHPVQLTKRQELIDLITTSNHILSKSEIARAQSALDFDRLRAADAMVPKDKIITVDITETVGPLLLDRLHKAGHNMFVAIKGDINDIKGWLYMSDVVAGHSDVKTVNDAVRPTVHYIGADCTLQDVIATSLQSGRQLFIVVDNQGNTVGLISLRDALTKLLGIAPPAHIHLATNPKEVQNA